MNTTNEQHSGYHTEFKHGFSSIASKVSLHVRRKMYQEFAKRFANAKSVLDVGVTSENVAPEANYFEDMFPHKDRITAVGIEDASNLEREYPGLKFVKVAPGAPLPFTNNHFEVAFSNAVIEHVVDDKQRIEFLRELVRVSKNVFLTTPNKYFWVEPHTGVPFLHFVWPSLFYSLLDKKRLSKFYDSSNLRLLTRTDLLALAKLTGLRYEIKPIHFCGVISNWILVLSK